MPTDMETNYRKWIMAEMFFGCTIYYSGNGPFRWERAIDGTWFVLSYKNHWLQSWNSTNLDTAPVISLIISRQIVINKEKDNTGRGFFVLAPRIRNKYNKRYQEEKIKSEKKWGTYIRRCILDECNKRHHAKGYCSHHYYKNRKEK